jgi:large conductance mechanosensitive channel
MLKEFRDFIMRGNVIDLAVGIIIGLAFGAIVTSLVNDIIMPVVGLVIGGVDFSHIVLTLKEAQGETPAVTMNIGVFINTIINFLIVGFAMFLVVRAVNRLSKMRQAQAETGEAPPEPTVDEKTLAVLEKLDAKLDKIVS